jgi:hypothetical protein
MRLPLAYGSPSRTLAWPSVQQRLEQALHYWLATTRPDGRPHLVPVDGLWLDGVWYFGGSSEAVYQRNLRTNDEVVVHLEDAVRAVIIEGRATRHLPRLDEAARLAAASKTKYGYAPPVEAYTSGVWAVSPRRVLAWDSVAEDATRFEFAPAE